MKLTVRSYGHKGKDLIRDEEIASIGAYGDKLVIILEPKNESEKVVC